MENKLKKILEVILTKTKNDILKWKKVNLKISNNRFLNFYVKKNNLLIGSIDIYESSYKDGYLFLFVNNNKNNDLQIALQPTKNVSLTKLDNIENDLLKDILNEILEKELNFKPKEFNEFIEELLED